MKNFYTYAYLREEGTPYYIGKGCGDRWKSQHRVAVPPAERVLFLKEGLTEAQAFAHEVYLIAVLGRKDLGTGCLRNLTDGGEGVSGRVVSEETRQRIKNKLTGVKHTEERRRAMSEAGKGRTPWNKGKKGTWSGCKPPGQAGKRWWKNTSLNQNVMAVECPGEGWEPGRCKGALGRKHGCKNPHKGTTNGRKWFHNPLTNERKMCYSQPNKDWLPGRGASARKG